MIKCSKDLLGRTLEARDGAIGSIHDIYFDDRAWRIRYFVVDTAKWLPGRRVLVSTRAVRRPWRDCAGLPVDLTRDQVRHSPDIDTARPVSREAEVELLRHYGWAFDWASSLLPAANLVSLQHDIAPREPHLFSDREMLGYEIRAADKPAGKLDDLLVDPEGSRIRYLLVNSGDWLARKKVLLSPECVSRIDWADAAILTPMSRHDIACRPEYNPEAVS